MLTYSQIHKLIEIQSWITAPSKIWVLRNLLEGITSVWFPVHKAKHIASQQFEYDCVSIGSVVWHI